MCGGKILPKSVRSFRDKRFCCLLRVALPSGRCGVGATVGCLCSFDTSENCRRQNAELLAEANQHRHGRALVVVFQFADVSTVNAGRDGKLLLRLPGCQPRFS